MILTIRVYGLPAPQGSKRHVGRGVMVESSNAVKPWREAVKFAAIESLRVGPDDEHGMAERLAFPFGQAALAVSVTFTLPKPQSAPKTRRTWPQRKPDIDKLVRSTFDALTDAGVWRDDSQVVDLVAVKTYPGESMYALPSPGAVIHVTAIGGAE